MWSEKDLEQKKKDGKIRDYNIPAKIRTTNAGKIGKRSKEKDWLAWNMQYWCNEKAVTLEPEYQFHPYRKYRFDWAIPALMIGVEYEGIMSKKSRHTTIGGYSADSDKYNLAQQLGWKVFRVTALNYKTILQTLNEYAQQIN